MKLIPISDRPEENKDFTDIPSAKTVVGMSLDYYQSVGYLPPWISYLVEENGSLIGFAGFKGPPKNGAVEIAYGTEEVFRNKGKGNQICRLLVDLTLLTDPDLVITARTLPENNYSTRILEKNNFLSTGFVTDPEDGQVWEWVYQPG